jgi:hypothetical protein
MKHIWGNFYFQCLFFDLFFFSITMPMTQFLRKSEGTEILENLEQETLKLLEGGGGHDMSESSSTYKRRWKKGIHISYVANSTFEEHMWFKSRFFDTRQNKLYQGNYQPGYYKGLPVIRLQLLYYSEVKDNISTTYQVRPYKHILATRLSLDTHVTPYENKSKLLHSLSRTLVSPRKPKIS